MAEALALQANPLETTIRYNTMPQASELPEAFIKEPEIANPAVETVTASMVGNAAERANSRFDTLSRIARRGGVAVLGALAIGTAMPEKAHGETTQQAPQVTELSTGFKFNVAGSSMSEQSFSKVTVLGNHRTISKAKMHKAEVQDNCVTLNGKKVDIWTQGHYEKGNPYGKDTRTSRFCKVVSNGATHWYRKACGNAAKFKQPKKAVEGAIIWVKNFNKVNLKVSATSHAVAKAECKTDNTSALGYGEGEGKATARLRLKSALKVKGKLRKLITRNKLRAEGVAKSSATAKAMAFCAEAQPTTTETGKDGTSGAGAGTQGTTNTGSTVGGSGAGGSAGNETASYPCYDSADTQNGDGNASTEGGIMYVDSADKVDQNQYCVGPAEQPTNP